MLPDTTNPSSRSRNAAIDAAFEWSNALVAVLAGLVELNLQTVKASLAEQGALADATLAARSIGEIVDLQSRQVPAAVRKSIAYWRDAKDVVVQTQSGLFVTVSEQIENRLRTFARTLTPGSGGALAQTPRASASPIIAVPPGWRAAGSISVAERSDGIWWQQVVQRYPH